MPPVRNGHTPVALERFWELAGPALARPGSVYVDATVGLGGHAALVAERSPDSVIIGLDRDPLAVRRAGERLGQGARIVQAPFAGLDGVLDALGIHTADAVLFDLGVSSVQLDSDERGFAYSRDTFLDMRMDPTTGPTAADVLATYTVADLTKVLATYGEERFASRIARAVVKARDESPVERSSQLVELIRRAIPAPARRQGGHPAKRTFQALRIEVNCELAQLEAALPQAVGRLAVGGRIIVMSYQSLEDALVKRVLTAGASSAAPPGLPIEPESTKPYLSLLTRGAERASAVEIAANPRSAPLKLRAAKRIRETL
ncbi:MAG: 16S rRNA (cytosine(1402)-N(4))-methyltransferase RsmH [Bifidobacteriaceae bacterium]|jgi:16S rRNA (cytosine1402-N4)-methyltransferase|nr:16S rRNA (cytosine(1402)-N(4))-methyltransferase RsmH [Bifidobacteriaceae bacterium]